MNVIENELLGSQAMCGRPNKIIVELESESTTKLNTPARLSTTPDSNNYHSTGVKLRRQPFSNPTIAMACLGGGSTLLGIARGCHIKKTFNTLLKITLLCACITALVLRGTIGTTGNPSFTQTHALGPRISNWDEQRKNWLMKNPEFPSHVNGKARVLLVTGSPPGPCDTQIGDHYLLKFIKNKIDYCRIHGIDIVYNMALLDEELSGCWAKLPLTRRLMLSHPEVEWIWWMDSDALFTDMIFEIQFFKYDNYNLVLHGLPESFNQKSWVALNTGSFLLRNCQWSLDLLDAWAAMGPKGRIREKAGEVLTAYLKGRPELEADDQSALIYLLSSKKDAWMGKVYLESSYYFNLHEKIMEKYDRPLMGDERWPFVTHFIGCRPCGSHADHAVEKFLRSMESAFNFADNQVLRLYGFEHRGLLRRSVKRIRNETTAPLEFVDQWMETLGDPLF